MLDDFNMAASVAQEEPMWSSGPWPTWGRSGILSDDDDDGGTSAGDDFVTAMENYAAVMEGIQEMREAWPGYGAEADAIAEAEEAEARALEMKARADEALRVIFDQAISEANVLQQPLRVSRPIAFRARPPRSMN